MPLASAQLIHVSSKLRSHGTFVPTNVSGPNSVATTGTWAARPRSKRPCAARMRVDSAGTSCVSKTSFPGALTADARLVEVGVAFQSLGPLLIDTHRLLVDGHQPMVEAQAERDGGQVEPGQHEVEEMPPRRTMALGSWSVGLVGPPCVACPRSGRFTGGVSARCARFFSHRRAASRAAPGGS